MTEKSLQSFHEMTKSYTDDIALHKMTKISSHFVKWLKNRFSHLMKWLNHIRTILLNSYSTVTSSINSGNAICSTDGECQHIEKLMKEIKYYSRNNLWKRLILLLWKELLSSEKNDKLPTLISIKLYSQDIS